MKVQHITAAGATVYFPSGCHVASIRVVNMTTASHVVEIQDAAGNHLWGTVAAGANYVEESIRHRLWETGFKVPTLDSGYLDVETYTQTDLRPATRV